MATTQFCLTNAGANLIGPTVSLLSNLDNFTTPFQTGISLSSLQPPNCPATLTVPDTATQIKVLDPNTNQCAAVNLLGNDLCTLFNLQIDTYQSQSTGQIIFGDFTTSFGPVTDYLIYWYRNGSTTPQFITGKGTLFTPYGNTHPLTGSAALLAPSGTYSIEIAKIQINGLNFSTLDTPPSGFIKATTSCIPTTLVTVTALNCGNGNFTPTSLALDYTHKFEFNNASVGTPPQALSTTFDLSTNTNYLAYYFLGNSVYDTLKIVFYGANYPNPIVLENISIGFDSSSVGGGTIPQSVTKNIATSVFKKVIRLNMLNRSSSDYLTITVTPNQTFNQTIWSLYLKCLTSFNCAICGDQFINQNPKIIQSETTTTIGTCNSFSVTTKIQACSAASINNSDISKYINYSYYDGLIETTVDSGLRTLTSNGLNSNIRTCSSSSGSGASPQCAQNTQGTSNVTTSVSNGCLTITVTFTNSATYDSFYNVFLTRINSLRSSYPNYNNPLHIDHYRLFLFKYPNQASGCGDGTQFGSIRIPIWTTYTSDSNVLTINYCQMPSNTAQNFINANNITNCDTNCEGSINSYITNINSQITNLTNSPVNLTNTTGSYSSNAFSQNGSATLTGPSIFEVSQTSTNTQVNVYSNTTFLMNESGQLIDNTPYKVCDFEQLGWGISSNPTYQVNNVLGNYTRDFYNYLFTPRTPYNSTYPDDFTIYGRTVTNGVISNTSVIAYQKLNGVITVNNTFVI
jgi:hypothetical protein